MAEYIVKAQRTEYLEFKVTVPDDVAVSMQVVQEALNAPYDNYPIEVKENGAGRPTDWFPTQMAKSP